MEERTSYPYLIFVSAQPDTVYFHWQVELYLYQFSKYGIEDRCYALFGYRDAPSQAAIALSKKYKGIRFYKDSRDHSASNFYIPSIRPHILKQFFAENPELGGAVFYHDSDIFIVRMPKFELMLNDATGYVSDTVSYIGYKYIMDCAGRYKATYPALPDDDIFVKMCAMANIDPELVKRNDPHSGGAQYLLKNVDGSFWEEVEVLTNALYSMLSEYERAYPIGHHIQKWTADMWAVLWIYWKRGNSTQVHSELNFSWATDGVYEYHTRPIFHLAGVTSADSNKFFFKGDYTNKNVFAEYRRNKALFDYILPNNATIEYVKVIKEYVDGITYVESSRFLVNTAESWGGIYTVDLSTNVCNRPIWRSMDGTYIMFYNNSSWTVTSTIYLQEAMDAPQRTGGFASNSGVEPYDNDWNKECTITLM